MKKNRGVVIVINCQLSLRVLKPKIAHNRIYNIYYIFYYGMKSQSEILNDN